MVTTEHQKLHEIDLASDCLFLKGIPLVTQWILFFYTKKIQYSLNAITLQLCTQDIPQVIILFWFAYRQKMTNISQVVMYILLVSTQHKSTFTMIGKLNGWPCW